MKRILIILCALLALAGCSKQWNDLVPPNEAKGENVKPDDPKDDPKEDPKDDPKEDPQDNPQDPQDDPQDDPPAPKEGPQLYNMNFDLWSKGGKKEDCCYGEDATDAEKAVWGSANGTTQALGYPTVGPEDTFLAVTGEGKRALKLQTQGMSLLFGAIKKMAAGSIFNGYTGDIDIMKMSAKIFWGIPFSDRPVSLEGYACYKPGSIDWTQDPYKSHEGQLDNGHIFVILSDWEQPFEVSPPDKLFSPDDPAVIGYGKVVFDKKMDAYETFKVDIEYKSERTPKYLAIVASSSALGDYFTGSGSSVLYLDELKFNY